MSAPVAGSCAVRDGGKRLCRARLSLRPEEERRLAKPRSRGQKKFRQISRTPLPSPPMRKLILLLTLPLFLLDLATKQYIVQNFVEPPAPGDVRYATFEPESVT